MLQLPSLSWRTATWCLDETLSLQHSFTKSSLAGLKAIDVLTELSLEARRQLPWSFVIPVQINMSVSSRIELPDLRARRLSTLDPSPVACTQDVARMSLTTLSGSIDVW